MKPISEQAKEKIRVMMAFVDQADVLDELQKALFVEYGFMGSVLEARSIGSLDVWEVRRSARTNEVYCTCPRYKFRKKWGLKNCKHVTALLAEGVEIPVYKGKRVFGVSTGQ